MSIAPGDRAASRPIRRRPRKDANKDTPANVFYSKITGPSRESKLTQLDGISTFSDIQFQKCWDDWGKPFLPSGAGDFFQWPLLVDIFPWTHTGAQFQRTWPIGETDEVLIARWSRLVGAADDAERTKLFKNSRDRNIHYKSRDGESGAALSTLSKGSAPPAASSYMFRSFDRHRAFLDPRLGDYLRWPLIETQSGKQIFLMSLITEQLGQGAGIAVAPFLPDLNCFHGRHGMVMPLYRDAAATEPNLTDGLVEVLGKQYGEPPLPEDIAAYVYATLGGQLYTKRFWNELETPGPRVPLTKDAKSFAATAALGKRLIWLHTYAERFRGADRGDEVPAGSCKNIKGVSSDPENYPEEFSYDPSISEVRIGDGRFGPLASAVWDFEVSGLKVLQSWLGYRMKKRAGRKSSPLDDIRPEQWTPRMTDEFLELVWVLEATLSMDSSLSEALEKVVAGPCFKATELPSPTEAQRRPPGGADATGDLLEMMEEDDDQTVPGNN